MGPGMKRAAIFNDTRAAKHFGCDLVMHRLISQLADAGIECTRSFPVAEDWRERTDLPKSGEIDIVIVNGEGSIHHSATRPRAVFLSEISRYAQQIGVPSVLLNSTIDEIDRTVADNIDCFDQVYVRENHSQSVLSQFGVASSVVPDLTVMVPYRPSNGREGICATDNVRIESKREIRARCGRDGWPYRSMVWKGLTEFDQDPADDARLENALKFADFLSGHELVVTGRFHTVTLCVATQTPMVAVESNTPKISAFLHDVLGSARRVVTSLPEDVSGFRGWTADEDQAIRRFLATSKTAESDMFESIAALIPSAAKSRGWLSFLRRA